MNSSRMAAAHLQLTTANCQLTTANCQLTTANCQLTTANCQLTTADRLRRSGTTLVEMLVVMSVASVMLGVSVTTIHLLLDAEREATRAVRFTTSIARLAQAFRSDVHAARQVELPDSEDGLPSVLVARIDGGTVRYELDAHLATRIEMEGERQVHREVYYFPPQSRLSFETQANRDKPGQKNFVLEIDTAAAGRGMKGNSVATNSSPKRKLVIAAAPGRNHRFEKPE